MLCLLLEKIPPLAGFAADITGLKASAESISRQLGAWVRSRRDSELKGERYVSEKTRRADTARRDREEFLKELEWVRKGGAPYATADSRFKIQDSRFRTSKPRFSRRSRREGD